tara:strand:+ start:1443 stop:3389 length:1947 start_codon:yes stop_codon:yes gene_type:complete
VKYLFLSFIFSFNVFSNTHKFKFLKLGPELEMRQELMEMGVHGNNLPPLPGEDNTDLHRRLLNMLRPTYRGLGKAAVDAIFKHNQNFDLGKYNNEGIAWTKPVGIFNVGANREVKPHPKKPGKFLVHDVFTIGVGAITYLKYLKKLGVIDISMKNIGLFTGLGYQRTYRYVHEAETYMKGLRSNFLKLFLTFIYIHPNHFASMELDERIEKEDYFGFDGGIAFESPVWHGLSALLGVRKGFGFEHKLKVTSHGPRNNPNQPFLTMRAEVKKSNTTGLFADLLLDLRAIYKLTLLSFEISTEKSKSDVQTFVFPESTREMFYRENKKNPIYKNVKRLNRYRFKRLSGDFVANFQDSMAFKKELEKNRRQHFVKYGGLKTVEHEETRELSRNKREKLFKLSSENLKYTKSIWKDVTNNAVIILKKIPFLKEYSKYINYLNRLDYHLETTNHVSQYKVKLNYKGDDSIGDTNYTGLFAKADDISIEFTSYLHQRNTHRFFDWFQKKQVLKYLNTQASFDEEIVTGFRRGTIRGPMTLESTVKVTPVGLSNFMNLTTGDFLSKVLEFCSHTSVKSSRKCTKKLKKRFRKFAKSIHPVKGVNVNKLESLLKGIQEYGSLGRFNKFFDSREMSANGSIKALTKRKKNFTSYFRL